MGAATPHPLTGPTESNDSDYFSLYFRGTTPGFSNSFMFFA